MKLERYQIIEELYHAALGQTPEARGAFLKQACNGDEALRHEVESLIEYDQEAELFIERPPDELAAALMADERQSLVGRTLGHYRVVALLGIGGMGEVYLAEDLRLNRRVALKLLPGELINNPDRLRRFKQEARAASALNHPNILTIYDIGESDNKHYIAAEYIEGKTLRNDIHTSPMNIREVLDASVQIASALSAAHQAGIIHRDIKPENIMLRPDGIIKVLDFGLAKLSREAGEAGNSQAATLSKRGTDPGTVMGTVQYMSPEQARGKAVDARSDIFGFGIVLYELISGRAPFTGESSADILVAILNEEALPLDHLVEGVPPALQRMVTKCLRKAREERYQTMHEVLGELRELRDELALEARLERSLRPLNRDAENQPTLIANGETTKDQMAQATGAVAANTTSLVSRLQQHKLGVATSLIILVSLFGLGIYRFIGMSKADRAPHFERVKITKLTKSGKVISAVISPDGKYFAQVISDSGKQIILVRQTSTNHDITVVPAAAVEYWGLTFSKDSNDLFYVAREFNGPGVLYRIPALGGTRQRLLEGIDSPVTFSPDGKRIAYVRGDFPNNGESALMTANADGTEEKVIAIRQRPERFYPLYYTGPSWSPDGKTLAATIGGYGSGMNFKVIGINLSDGKELDLTQPNWGQIGRVEWLADGAGLIMIAREQTASYLQVWYIAVPGNEARQVSNDFNDYRSLSLTADSSKLVTIKIDRISGAWVAPLSDIAQIRQVTPADTEGAMGISWTPSGKLVYSTNLMPNSNLWIMEADGSGQKQLTSNSGANLSPQVSPDGNRMVFFSNRTGVNHIWISEIDGNNQKQLTNSPGDNDPTFSADGKWVIYTSNPPDYSPETSGLWKIPSDGGSPIRLVGGRYSIPAVSPDGKLIAAMYIENRPVPDQRPDKIAIIPIDGGAPVKTFAIQNSLTAPTRPRWTADGKNLIYNQVKDNIGNLWIQPLTGGPPKQISNFRDSFIYDFFLSQDGKQIVISRGNYSRDAIMFSNER